MKNVEPVREFFAEHVKSVMDKQNPNRWVKDESILSNIWKLESEISLIRDHPTSDDDSEYRRIQSEIYPLECDLRELREELAKRWQTAYPFVTVADVIPTSFSDKWDIGWEIDFWLETEEGEIAIVVKATHKKIVVEIGEIVLGFVGKNMKKVSDNFDIHNDFDKRRMFHHLSAK